MPKLGNPEEEHKNGELTRFAPPSTTLQHVA